MRLVTFREGHGARVGLAAAKGVVDMSSLRHPVGNSIAEILGADRTALEKAAAEAENCEGRPESELHLAPCITQPGKIVCVGRNYREHASETGNPVPDTPLLFAKFGNTVAASGEPVPLPDCAEQFDYEAEMGVVIGRTASRVSEERALDYVFGYFNANDLTARDLQFRTSQWLLGKSLDRFFPIGPYLVTADEVGDPQQLSIRCWVNGELRQNSSTSDMVFGVAQLVSYISTFMTLDPGDIISTGTPEGVILGMKEKHWLVPGDEVTVEVGDLGRLSNRLVAATS